MHISSQLKPPISEQNQSNNRVSMKLVFWLIAFILALLGSTGILNEFPKLGWCVTTLIGAAAVAASRFLPPLALILIFNFLFFIYSIPHVWFGVDLVSTPVLEGLPYLTQCNWIISLFLSCLILWITNDTHKQIENFSYLKLCDRLRVPKASKLFYAFIAIIALATAFGIKGSIVLGIEGGYDVYMGNLSGASGLQEYLLVPLFISGVLMRTRLQRILWYITISFFIIKLNLLGLRVVALMGIILALWFSRRDITFKKLVYIFFIGYISVSLIGLLKGGMGSSEILASLFFEVHGESVVSHHSNVLWASSSMLKLIDFGIVDVYRRLELFIYYMGNTLIPSGILQGPLAQVSLGSWLQEKGYSSGGGHAAIYAFVAAGVPGVIGFSSLFGWAINRSTSKKVDIFSGGVRCWLMMTFITFPRWISYDIGNFYFRLPLYTAILYMILMAMRTKNNNQVSNQI